MVDVLRMRKRHVEGGAMELTRLRVRTVPCSAVRPSVRKVATIIKKRCDSLAVACSPASMNLIGAMIGVGAFPTRQTGTHRRRSVQSATDRLRYD